MRKSQHVIQQRQQDMLALFRQHGRMLVGELSAKLGVSEITVRRDMEALSRSGELERFHGGGVLPQAAAPPSPHFEEKALLYVREKALIAETVAALIPDEATVSINAGTTTLEVIRSLKPKPVRIVSNNAMASAVLQESVAEFISTGGEYSGLTRAFTGEFASHVLNKVFADVCVLGANGITATTGVTSSVYKETFLNELMVNRCRGRCIIAADGSKVGNIHCFSSVPIDKVHTLVTDASADADALAEIRAAGVEVIVVRVAENA